METVTIQGRVARLESMVAYLANVIEDREDILFMREAEATYRAGDSASFADLLAEVKAETAD